MKNIEKFEKIVNACDEKFFNVNPDTITPNCLFQLRLCHH